MAKNKKKRNGFEDPRKVAKRKAKEARIEAMKNGGECVSGKLEASRKIKPEDVVRTVKPRKKSLAKAAGLKSTFILGEGRLLMTSFGKGNDAVIEKEIQDATIRSINDPEAFAVRENKTGFEIISRRGKPGSVPTTDNPFHESIHERRPDAPLKGEPGMDDLGAKKVLEEKFFGKTFDDNIHIQLIHCIQDIEKIMSSHISDIIYVVDNLRRKNCENYDFVGSLDIRHSFDVFRNPEDSLIGNALNSTVRLREKFNDIMSGMERTYLGNALYNVELDARNQKKAEMAKKKNNGLLPDDFKYEKETEDDLKRYYYSLCLLGMARQSLFHGEGARHDRSCGMYQLDPEFDEAPNWALPDVVKAREDARQVLDNIYSARVRKLNDDFISLARKDLTVLFEVYSVTGREEKTSYLQRYYDFVVRKQHNNTGFSLSKLRNNVLDGPDGECIRTNCEQSMWSKFTRGFNFIAYDFYQHHPERTEEILLELRASTSDEEKDSIYYKEAEILWSNIREVVMGSLLPRMDPQAFREMEPDMEICEDMLDGVKISVKADYFTEFIYMMTLFLDGKEIGILLTQLLKKFENIAGFLSVMEALGLDAQFNSEYRMFGRSSQIASELKVVNRFARMEATPAAAKKPLYADAIKLLGFSASDELLEIYVGSMLGDVQAKERLKDLSGESIPGKNLRNFISNNVIESSRFKYVARYCDPASASAIARNRRIVKFVLNDIPEKQLKRYYVSCFGDDQASLESMKDQLTREIALISIEKFADVNQQARTADERIYKERRKGLLGLYLTVIYLVIKNLVYINARYSLAFHCFERDYPVLVGCPYDGNSKKRNKSGWVPNPDYCPYKGITQKFIEEKKLNGHARDYLTKNLANYSEWATKLFRNNVAHLNAIRNVAVYARDMKKVDSYYALYHYVMQRSIIEKYNADFAEGIISEEERACEKFFADVTKYNTYKKDFVKALNIPFGYCLPRYKNLSIDGLFDKNRPRELKSAYPDGE